MAYGPFRNARSLLILVCDLLTISVIFSCVYYVRLKQFPDYLSFDLWLIISTFLFTLFISGTYFKERSTKLPRLPVRTFFVCVSAGIICTFWVYLSGPTEFNNYFGRGVLFFGTLFFGISATLNRYIINRSHFRQEEERELLYLGFSESGTAFLSELNNREEVHSVSLLSKTAPANENAFKNTQIIRSDSIDQALHKSWQAIILDPNHHSDSSETSKLVSLRLRGTPVLTLAEYYERQWYMVPVDHIEEDWFLRSQGFSMLGNPVSLRIKRVIDFILSTVMLIISIPIVFISALLIKLTSKGPVFFKQTRVGLNAETFTIYKLRTMIQDAELDGAQWAEKNDPRVTIIGNILRKSRLDELPQCWNVVKGEMSFVGPRPERPEFTKELAETIPYYELRHMIKPGITGWAQVIFPYGASVDDSMKKLQYELYYIKNQSLLLDLNIILRTLITVFQRAGR